jgi:acid phosphatase class B
MLQSTRGEGNGRGVAIRDATEWVVGTVIVGFDYWQVLSHYPRLVTHLIQVHANAGDTVHVVSAIGQGRVGTVEGDVRALTAVPTVHEVVFRHPKESPVLKLAKCQELGIELFYDDREDVCRLLNRHGILALRVPRRDDPGDDLSSERR